MTQRSAERYAELVRAAEAHQRDLRAEDQAPARPDRWKAQASRYREDPFREHETLKALLSYIEPADTVLDVGGGAGRYLPLSLHCQNYFNVEPSAGMGAQFKAAVQEAGIDNAKWIESDWLGAKIDGDVCFTANVVYYIEDIVPFVQKLRTASRRRVMIVMHSVPPRNVGTELARVVYGHEPPPDPGFKDLLPVLWDMGLLPEVRVLGPSDFIAERQRYADRTEAVEAALPARLEGEAIARAKSEVEKHFDQLFVSTQEGDYRRRPNGISRVLLITWETRPSVGDGS